MGGVNCGRTAYFADDSVSLYLGDAGEVLSAMPDGFVDCVVTSPPYYGLRDYGADGQLGIESTVDGYVKRLVAVLHELGRVLAADGTLWLNLADCYSGSGKGRNGNGTPSSSPGKQASDRGGRTGTLTHSCRQGRRKSLLGVPWRVALALMDDGWTLRNEIVWHKPNAMPSSARDRFTVKHETLFLLTRGERYWFDLDAVKLPATAQSPRALSWNRDTKETDHPGIRYRQHRTRRHDSTAAGTANPGDVWTMPNRPFHGAHYATFPLDLPLRCIQAGCKPGGQVMDPFNGSGTTGQAAALLGHPYTGIDINAGYLDLSLHTRLAARAITDQPSEAA